MTEAQVQMGTLQNRLASSIENLSQSRLSISQAQSRILDADFASETALLSKNQIIQQANVSVLAQANQQTSVALQLLA